MVPLPPSPFNLDHQYHHLFHLQVPHTCLNSSLSSPVFLAPAQVAHGRRTDHFREPQNFQFQLLEADHNIVSYGGSAQTLENQDQKGTLLKLTISRNGADHHRNGKSSPSTRDEINTSSLKWTSSRKMTTNPDQTMDNVPFIRVCSDCNTTKTPLWRSCPRGPKSLCNACGIRQRKARRAMVAAAAAASGATLLVAAPSMKTTTTTTTTTSKVQLKVNKSSPKSSLPFKKRCNNKMITPKKICFEDHFTITMKNNNNSPSSAPATAAASLQAVFPQDEKEAATLLMALSCGLVHG